MSPGAAPAHDLSSQRLLIDAHAHVGEAKALPWEFPAPGVYALINSTGMEDLASTADYVRRHQSCSSLFVGLHPTNPHRDLSAFSGWVEGHATLVNGIGEIGLDRRIELADSRKEFVAQLELASRLGMPVSVHTKGRVKEALDDLSSFDLKTLLHWFQGTEAELRMGLDRGYFFSYGPPILYSKKMERLLAGTDGDRLLLETDSPVRYAACFESRESQPILIASVYFKAAEILKREVNELELSIWNNAYVYLGRHLPSPHLD